MITALLPITGEGAGLDRALASLRAQSLPPDETILILNGAAPALRARPLASHNLRVLDLPHPNLAAALNEGARAARHPLLARQDVDDESLPERLALQAAFLDSHPDVAGVGTAFTRTDASGATLATVHPPRDPAEVRWRLLLDNCFCHGSMLLRRDALLSCGGYDESLARAQDYDLWLRLATSHKLANLPQVLYRYNVGSADRAGLAGDEQARIATECLRRAWRDLAPAHRTGLAPDAQAALRAAWADPRAAPAALRAMEATLTRDGPTSESLLACLLIRQRIGTTPAPAHRAARRARLREVGARLRARGVSHLALWGAGDHSAWILDHALDLGLTITAIVDDARAGERLGELPILAASSLAPGEHALLSSDWHEDALWAASEPARARGITVHRLYGDGS